jgi:hypothetical protein
LSKNFDQNNLDPTKGIDMHDVEGAQYMRKLENKSELQKIKENHFYQAMKIS